MPPDSTPPVRRRIHSLDILRGLVIILMAIDHIRDFFAMTPESPENMEPLQAGWFFTRWITHFCAPVFVFLAGTAAFLYGNKIQNKGALSRFLITRGLWLILIEVLVINTSWTLMVPYQIGFVFWQVIWAIAWGMIVLAVLIWLPKWFVAAFSFILIAGHNALDGLQPEAFGGMAWLWKILHMGFSAIPLTSSVAILVVYPLIPWVAVLSAGYLFGEVMTWDQARRFRFILRLGIGLSLLFVVLRFWNGYGDGRQWSEQPTFLGTIMTFLNVTGSDVLFVYLVLAV